MSLSIHYTGQLANLLGTSCETTEVSPGTRLQAVVDWVMASHGPPAEPFFRDARGGLPSTLMVIFDGQQVDGDRAALEVSGVRDLMFMTPIAGG
jgi:hypothetical protein